MQDDSLRELDRNMTRLADGDRGASTPVFLTLWPRLVAFAERALGSGADADDAAQQALAKLFEQVADYDPARSALGWALAITSWECRTILTKRRRRKEDSLEGGGALASQASEPDESVVTQTLYAALDVAVAELSTEDRHTLRQAFFPDGNDGPEGPTFRKRKQRSLERLRLAWRRLYES